MTGDAPQPGETPRTEGNPWTFDPDAAWWRGDDERERAEAVSALGRSTRRGRRRAPAEPEVPPFAPEALDAHAAGAQDTTEVLTPDQAGEKERDHDRPAPDRYRPDDDAPDLAHRPEGVPDVMVLPEPQPDRGAVPGQTSSLTRLTAAEQEIKRSRLEHSPFWLNEGERAAAGNAWPTPETRSKLATAPAPVEEGRGQPPRHRTRTPRDAAPGLLGLIALGLIAAFFSWVSAAPFWLAAGHGDQGYATVSRCSGSGVTQRCAGSFAAADGSYQIGTVTLFGVGDTSRNPGAVAPARMVNPNSKQAYVGSTGWLLNLRWVLGFLLVLLCGLGIAGLTGTRQLDTLRARRTALAASLAGPVLLLIGFLFATY